MTMKVPLIAISLLGVGAGLAAGLIYRQRRTVAVADEEDFIDARFASEEEAEEEGDERYELAASSGSRRRIALLANPAPTTARLIVAAGSGVLAAWGATRGGLIGHGASVLGATMLGRVART